eukprot:3112447-Pyramimonas_sp.AAC.1
MEPPHLASLRPSTSSTWNDRASSDWVDDFLAGPATASNTTEHTSQAEQYFPGALPPSYAARVVIPQRRDGPLAGLRDKRVPYVTTATAYVDGGKAWRAPDMDKEKDAWKDYMVARVVDPYSQPRGSFW